MGNLRYSLKEMGVILTKANQAIQTLEKYKAVLRQSFTNLSALEFEELVTLQEVAHVINRVEMVCASRWRSSATSMSWVQKVA